MDSNIPQSILRVPCDPRDIRDTIKEKGLLPGKTKGFGLFASTNG